MTVRWKIFFEYQFDNVSPERYGILRCLGLDFHDPVSHFSTSGKNYERRFKDTNLFEYIFSQILSYVINHEFVNTGYMYVDSTHVKANANKRK